MKQTPILFSAPMVRAILDGRKTQTRRIFKGVNLFTDEVRRVPFAERFPAATKAELRKYPRDIFTSHGPVDLRKRDRRCEYFWHQCPYGLEGDGLWVKETFADISGPDHRAVYRADGGESLKAISEAKGWTSSIFMPRWASRITLEITGVRVERLQQISEEDAKAEGCSNETDWDWRPSYHDPDSGGNPTYRRDYQELWESINGPGSWAANPWCWVLTFSRV